MARRGQAAHAGIEMAGLGRFRGLVRATGDNKRPEWRAGAERIIPSFAGEATSRAPGSMTAQVRRVNSLFGPTVGAIAVNHPGAKVIEFGRGPLTIRPRDRRALSWDGAPHPVRIVHQPRRRPRPFIGIIRGDAAIAATRPLLEAEILRTLIEIWANAPEEN